MSLFGTRNTDHNTSTARNWTPALLATLAIARSTEGVKEKIRTRAIRLLRENKLNKDELLGIFLTAQGKLKFGHDELINFFGENYNFENVHGAIFDAMNLLCMRTHLENPGERGTTDITDDGHRKVKLILKRRNEVKGRITASKVIQKKAA